MFDEFHRAEQTIAHGYPGLGLGLTICKQLVALHDGTITIASPGQMGSGTTVRVQLPLREPTAAQAMPVLAAAAVAPGEHDTDRSVLVVDDDPGTAALYLRLIRHHGIAAHTVYAPNGRIALERMRQRTPDLVLLDLMMPDLDGYAVLAAMRAESQLRAVPVIVLSAQILTESDLSRLQQGVVSILSKGVFNADEVLAHLAAALSQAHRFGSAAQRIVRKAITYIHAHAAEPLLREHIAAHVGVHQDHLTDCFHQELGIPPMTYVLRFRIQQARALLETGNLSITAIALAVGFNDSAYFSRMFQRAVGMTPSAYRRGTRTSGM